MSTQTIAPENSRYRWYLLILVVLTNMFVVAVPTMGISVLAKEISQDLSLSLVQVGVVWGIGALPGIFTGLLGGAIGDKIGPKRILVVGCLLAGALGAGRGLATGFISLTLIVIFYGAISPVVIMNGLKTCGQWFPPHQLGLANGLTSMGMALGFLLGSFLSATTLSPLLGGWRNVLLLYGFFSMLLSVPWFFTRTLPTRPLTGGERYSLRRTVLDVARLKNIWLLGFALFGIGGCVQGVLGYLPLYLRGLGWDAISADGALSAFHLISMIFVLPIALWSDRLASRKRLILSAAAMIVIGVSLLSVTSGGLIWVAVLIAGMVRDGFMAILLTMVIESDGVGPVYAGTATGFVVAIGGVGNFLAPPLGNSLAGTWHGAPFVFWVVLALFGILSLTLVKARSVKVPAYS